MKKKLLSMMMAVTLTAGLCAGCGQGAGDDKENTGLENTDVIDSVIDNATAAEDSSGYVYTGEGPITREVRSK